MSSAERSRRYRQRQRHGVMTVTVEVCSHIIDALLEVKWLERKDADDRASVQAAMQRLLNAYADTVTRHDMGS